jgi:hypothetical protein
VGIYAVAITVSLWPGSSRVRVWFERIVERSFINGSGRLTTSHVLNPRRKIGIAMSSRNRGAVIWNAMARAVVLPTIVVVQRYHAQVKEWFSG